MKIPIRVKIELKAEVEPQYVDSFSEALRKTIIDFGEVKKATLHQSEVELDV